MARPVSQAVLRPAVASRNGKPQHDATPNAAATPLAVSRTAPAPTVGVARGITAQGKLPVTITVVPDTLEIAGPNGYDGGRVITCHGGDDRVAGLGMQIFNGVRVHRKAAL